MAVNHSLFLLKLSISIALVWVIHVQVPKHFDILREWKSKHVTGAIYGSC